MPDVPSQARTDGPGALLGLVHHSGVTTRAELAARTGLTRQAVAQRVDALLEAGLLVVQGEAASTGGRPAEILAVNHRRGIVLAADLGVTHARLALSDLGGHAFKEDTEDINVAAGPDAILSWLEDRFERLLADAGRSADEVSAIAVGVPGPVEFSTGRAVGPPIMPGWDGYPIADRLHRRYPVPVLIDNDVNVMALGEHRRHWPDCKHLLYIKVGTGIGCGIVVNGDVYRGSDGAAGDIGHIRVSDDESIHCECGNTGCLEAVASGRALARAARAMGREDVHTSRDVAALLAAHDPELLPLVRSAGRTLGTVLAALVNALNPSVVVIGGDIAHAHEQFFAGVREVVYQRSTLLAMRHLEITRGRLGHRAGVTGCTALAIEHLFSPTTIDDQLAALRNRRDEVAG